VSAPPITTPSESSSPTPSPPTTSKPPAPAPAPTTADIEITVLRAQAAEGNAETVTFETDNLGKAKVIHEEVFVEALGGGQIYGAEFRFEGGDTTSCAVDGATASCDLGGQALKGVFHIEVTVGWEPTSTGLKATVKDIGGTKDQDKSNNSVTYEHIVPTDSHTMYTFRPPDFTATIQPPAN
jgi:hypothetical protein